jgi:hypothetical protein
MSIRDDLFLTPGFRKNLEAILEAVCRDETLCRLSYVPPGQYQLYGQIGRILEVGPHWLKMETYEIAKPSQEGEEKPNVLKQFLSSISRAFSPQGPSKPSVQSASSEKLYVGTVFIPTQSINEIDFGGSPRTEKIQQFLEHRKIEMNQLLNL